MKLEDETPGTRRLYAEYQQEIWEHTDRMFLWLLVAQWLGGIATALWTSPAPGAAALPHLPLAWKAFFLGGTFAALPLYMAVRHPGSALTRREIAVGQGLLTALLIYLSGSRSEMRAVPFVSLAFLAMYRDPTVLLLASLVTAIGFSTYGVAHLGRWVWFTETLFVGIEDLLLILAIGKSQADLLGAARKQATIDSSRAALEREVAERQRTERLLSLQYVITRVLAGSGSLAEAAPFILRIMGENQGWQVGELWEVEEGRQFLRCVDLWHADSLRTAGVRGAAARGAGRRPTRGCRGGSGSGTCRSGSPTSPRSRRCRWPAFSAESGLHGAFAIPLRNGPEVIGVMAFYSGEVRQANDDHLSMLSALGGQIGQFMERKRVEQGLRDSEERYRSVIAALDEGIILVDAAGNVMATNASCERILARPSAEMAWRPSAETFASAVDEAEQPVAGGELPFLDHAADRASRGRTWCWA